MVNKRRVVITSGVIAMLLALAWAAAGPVRATLGNTGVPVRCSEAPGTSIQPAESRFLTCVAADGTPFVDGQRVPNGRYLLVTDIMVIPDGGTDVNALTDVTLYDAYGTSGRAYSLRLRGTTTAAYGQHFTTPYMVLPAGHRLEASTAWFAEKWVFVRVSGLLVTNVNYLPLVSNR
ncbi:MAG: hypothetical protein D6791_06630 [Chloroflexi bacterium]|nr:MAG: hypothetical protein D6791_06630 [Chloroflexota bacterium]